MARPKKKWRAVVFYEDEKKAETKGETLAEALVVAEENLQPFLKKLIKDEESHLI